MIKLLRKNVNVFTWLASDIPSIPADVIIHKLNVDPKFRLVQLKKRSFALEWEKAIDEKVDKLRKVGFIRETHYSKWIANVVMVK